MDLSKEFHPAPKPNYSRSKPKRKERGAITPEVYAKVFQRDGGRCVLCGKGVREVWTLEAHHCVFRSNGGSGEETNLLLLCGPATQHGTCHYRAHTESKIRYLLVETVSRMYKSQAPSDI